MERDWGSGDVFQSIAILIWSERIRGLHKPTNRPSNDT